MDRAYMLYVSIYNLVNSKQYHYKEELTQRKKWIQEMLFKHFWRVSQNKGLFVIDIPRMQIISQIAVPLWPAAWKSP